MSENEYYVKDVPKSEIAFCKIVGYSEAHSTLYVMVRDKTREDPEYYLVFTHVSYYSGSISWKGLSFTVADDDEYWAFLPNVHKSIIQQISLEHLDNFHLFINTSEDNEIRIMANAVSIMSHSEMMRQS